MTQNKQDSLTFSIQVKLVSINNFYYANKRHGLKPEARDMQYRIFNTIAEPSIASQFENLRSKFDPKKYSYGIKIIQNIPKSVLINKQGLMSAKSQDLSNTEKGLIDALMLSKFYGSNVPYQAPNLNTDDRFLSELFSKKQVSPDDNFSVDVEIYLIKR